MMQETDIKRLIESASEVRKHSYAPYSHFTVGAALMAKDGSIYTGVNVENASYPVGICAERTAFVKAVSEGKSEFCAIAIVGGRKEQSESAHELCYPCGLCRQFMAEWCKEDFLVIAAKNTNEYCVHPFSEILPFAFSLSKE